MQRQSLASPGRERLVNDAVLLSDDTKRRVSSSSSFSVTVTDTADIDEIKPEKPHRSHSSPEKLIHCIPVFLIFCFVVLYLSSHYPSPQELAQFHGINHKHLEQSLETRDDIDEIGGVDKNVKQLKRSGAFVIRSLSNLHDEQAEEEVIESESFRKARSHRKLGDF